MRRRFFEYAVLLGLFFPAAVLSGEAEKVGVVKGAITIGGKPASDAVVSVEGILSGQLETRDSKLKTIKAVMDQRDMKFTPRVLPVVVGTTVDFPNHDKTFHNVFSTSEAKKFDLGLYPAGKSRNVAFDKAGVVKILCNVHPNMEAFIVVKSHSYYAATDAHGNYRLNGVPLGKYRLEVWHPELEVRTVPVELVRDGEVLAIDLDLKKQN